jgi:hypothetical protein
MSVPLDTGASAEDEGRAAAEEFDRRLRERERAARQRRLDALRTLSGDDPGDDWRAERPAPFEQELLDLRVTLDAISRSRVWRLAQGLRGLVGRRW